MEREAVVTVKAETLVEVMLAVMVFGSRIVDRCEEVEAEGNMSEDARELVRLFGPMAVAIMEDRVFDLEEPPFTPNV